MHAMPILVVILCLMAIAYRYYSAFLAAHVATLDDLRRTPAVMRNDGQNYHPTNKWVLFGHHFAAISGAGPLIGPVLAAQFGYMPGLIWIVVGVCLAGAVQDFLVLAMSLRRGGTSLARIAYTDIGKSAGTAATIAILFIIVIALAGLGKVVVKALGGEEVKFPAGAQLVTDRPGGLRQSPEEAALAADPGDRMTWNGGASSMTIQDGFWITLPHRLSQLDTGNPPSTVALPPDSKRIIQGSSWGTFTIACTIPIALFVGLYMYKIRPGRVIEASLIGAALTLAATVLGGLVPGSRIESLFNLSQAKITWLMAGYGFVASILPVWVLLCPRDYLSSFLKIGTIGLLVVGVIIANPLLAAPAFNHVFAKGGPVVPGQLFPFLFIIIMCGAISGFHALVSSGTTPKMIARESDARTIGYGAMLIEGLVGVVAMIAAATLPPMDYYAMNVDLAQAPAYHDRILAVAGAGGVEHVGDYEALTHESLRGRTGGAVTLAVGVAHIFDQAARHLGAAAQSSLRGMWKYWYHFAIMFEALFILTTIDTGTRIGRFLLQEVFGHIAPKWADMSHLPAAMVSTALITLGWVYFISANSMAAIWPMFGVANQTLAVIALAIVTVYLVNAGRAQYVWVTLFPMLLVLTTTSTAGVEMLLKQFTTIHTQSAKNSWTLADRTLVFNAVIQSLLIIIVLGCAYIVIVAGAIKAWPRLNHRPLLAPSLASE